MTAVDRTIAAMGLPRHPGTHSCAKSARDAAGRVDADGLRAIDMASALAARGYSASTLGDGGSRGTDDTSSTERHASATGEATRWFGVDVRLAQALQDWHRASVAVSGLVDELLRHAMDVDPVPSGTGECMGCGRFCRPDRDKPGNRLRSGLCPTDYRAWLRAGQPPRAQWVTERRRSFTDETGVLHTPEPDHDLDLSRREA